MHVWTNNDIHLKLDKDLNVTPVADIRNTIVWFYDELTFYAHDHCAICWVHENETAKPQPKGEGASLMVAHFVSVDYGYLQSPNGTETACVLFKAGKGWDGYYTNEHII